MVAKAKDTTLSDSDLPSQKLRSISLIVYTKIIAGHQFKFNIVARTATI
jgi:hypothetical protein